MSKSNKELAVELTCAILTATGLKHSNENIGVSSKLPDPESVIKATKFFLEQLNDIDLHSNVQPSNEKNHQQD